MVKKSLLKKFGNKICTESMHGTNLYDFHLTSIIVVDEFNQGFSIAFAISNYTRYT